MLWLTEVYDWEGDDAVKQRLVFLCLSDKDAFERALPNYKNTPDGSSAENGRGAFVKLRAVRNFDGTWKASVRSAITGYELVESNNNFLTWELALRYSIHLLKLHLDKCITLAIKEGL